MAGEVLSEVDEHVAIFLLWLWLVRREHRDITFGLFIFLQPLLLILPNLELHLRNLQNVSHDLHEGVVVGVVLHLCVAHHCRQLPWLQEAHTGHANDPLDQPERNVRLHNMSNCTVSIFVN